MSGIGDILRAERPDSLGAVRHLLSQAQLSGSYFPSPTDWRDHVLYFLLPDRFSDGGEDGRPLLTRNEVRELRARPRRDDWSWKDWADSGKQWQGGPCGVFVVAWTISVD